MVNVTDWLQIMVQEGALKDPLHHNAKEALDDLELGQGKALTVAASILVKLTEQLCLIRTVRMFRNIFLDMHQNVTR